MSFPTTPPLKALPLDVHNVPCPGSFARLLVIAFGIVLPIGCLLLDPFVFSSNASIFPSPRPGAFSKYKVVGYSAAGLGMLSLALWLVRRRPSATLAGLLLGGAVFALCLGVVLIPYSLIGLFFILGVFGFVPFGTAWVFAEQARSAWRCAGTGRSTWLRAVIGFAIACGVPWGLQLATWKVVRDAKEAVMSSDPIEAERGVTTLLRLSFVSHPDELVWAYEREQEPDRKERLAIAYRRVTGVDIDTRLYELRD